MNMKVPLAHQISHIAVVLNPDEDGTFDKSSALRRARQLAVRSDSALTLLAFLPPPTLTDNLAALVASSPADRDETPLRNGLFETARTVQEEDGVTVQCEIIESAFSAVAAGNWLESVPTDLLVIDHPEHHSRTTIADRFSALIRRSSTPVWFTVPDSTPAQGVVAAIAADVCEENEPAPALEYDVLDTARRIGNLFDADLHVVQARQPASLNLSSAGLASLVAVPSASGPALEASQSARRQRRQQWTEELSEFVAHAGGVDGTALVMEGEVATAVSAGAQALDAGLIVMGANSKSHWVSILLGGSAEATLAVAPCDLLVVKPSEHEDVRRDALRSQSAAAQTTAQPHEIDLLVHPRYHFRSPAAVLRHDGLNAGEKRLILSAWEEELRNELENETTMPQQVYEPTTDPDELESVKRSLERLGASEGVAA